MGGSETKHVSSNTISLDDYLYQEMTGLRFNELMQGKVFYKLINKTMIHNGFIFQSNALNIDTKEFCASAKTPCGIHFCESIDVHLWYIYNDLLMHYYSLVSIPNDAKIYIERHKIKADRVLLGEFKEIWRDPNISYEIIKHRPNAFQHIIRQTPDLCISAVTKCPDMLQYVKLQTHDMCLNAVKQDGLILRYVQWQTGIICLSAVKQNGLALQYVHNQIPSMCLTAVRQNGFALQHVKHQTPEICVAAVKQHPLAIRYVNKQTNDIVSIVKSNKQIMMCE
jgi:hypothetical protein